MIEGTTHSLTEKTTMPILICLLLLTTTFLANRTIFAQEQQRGINPYSDPRVQASYREWIEDLNQKKQRTEVASNPRVQARYGQWLKTIQKKQRSEVARDSRVQVSYGQWLKTMNQKKQQSEEVSPKTNEFSQFMNNRLLATRVLEIKKRDKIQNFQKFMRQRNFQNDLLKQVKHHVSKPSIPYCRKIRCASPIASKNTNP